ncbi:putative peptidase M76, ATP23 [Rosa chinensis]|uniref:Mitochondrial inner membrane protease ATP23 n=1 Tax=Rosa chinensis TaxID=74649 RepID=A0A2P6RLH8_ROSCH|nr:putative peptidase M76, ATP23 [Rosa chinensis]
MVKFPLEHLEKSGCGILEGLAGPFIARRRLPKYTPAADGNHMNMQDEVNQVVIHELIHAFDDCRAAPMGLIAFIMLVARFVLAILVVIAIVNVNFCCAKKIREL